MRELKNGKHFASISSGFSEAFVTGKFCDVKVVCLDSTLWAHRLVLSTVSPFLKALLEDFERRGEDVITIFLPDIKGYHMKLVLDYIYSGAMYLCGAHMQYVIQVMEVLQLHCGVSVNKMVLNQNASTDTDTDKWIEVEHSTVKIKSNPDIPKKACKEQKTPDTKHHKSKSDPGIVKKAFTASKRPASRIHKDADTSIEIIEDQPDSEASSRQACESDKEVNSLAVDTDSVNNETETVASEAEDQETTTTSQKESDPEEDTEPAVFDVEEVNDDDDDDDDYDDNDNDNDAKAVDDVNNEKEEEPKHGTATTNAEKSDDEMVVVEIDEAFAVDSVTSSENGKKHKCALCGRFFRFYENLRVHLTGHLGVKVSLSRCHSCKRNFKNQNELDLHMKSHSYARHLGKYRLVKSREETARREAKIITTLGAKDKKILRKYTKGRGNAGIKTRITKSQDQTGSEVEAVAEGAAPPVIEDDVQQTGEGERVPPGPVSCTMCPKQFRTHFNYLTHVQFKHKHLAEHIKDQKQSLRVKLTKCALPKSPAPASSPLSHSQDSPSTPSARRLSANYSSPGHSSSQEGNSTPNPYSRQYSTPSRRRRDTNTTTSESDISPPAPKRRKVSETPPASSVKLKLGVVRKAAPSPRANSLKCPDCDRVFVAKTIFDRHLYTAKHGVYSMYSSDSGPGSPHPTSSYQPKPKGGVDCHLCGQKFIRVKDLAKHREKVCTAYMNLGN